MNKAAFYNTMIINSISQKKFYKHSIILLLILLLGISLRVYKLGSRDLWYDEAYMIFNMHMLSDNPKALIHFVLRQNTPPLFYILHFLWIKFFGESEITLRFLPMLFGIFSIPIIYKLGKLFFNERVGLISSLIFSISPIHIWYSQEARAYSFSIFLSMIIVYLFFLALERDKRILWIGFVAASIIGIYTNYFCIFLIPISFLVLFFKRYRHLSNKWLISVFLIVISSFFWIRFFLGNIIETKFFFWIPKPSWYSIIITLENFNLGYNATQITNLFALILFSIFFMLPIIDFKRNREKIICSLLFLLIPIFVTFLISRYWFSIYIDRQLMLFSPFYYILIANGITQIRYRLTKSFILVSLSLLMVFSLYNYYRDYMPLPNIHHLGVHTKKPIKYIVQFIKQNQRQGDAVFYSHPSLPRVFWYYWRFDNRINKNHFFIYIPSATHLYWLNRFMSLKHPFIPIIMIILTEQNIKEYQRRYSFKRMWLISSSWSRRRSLDFESQAVRDWVDSHYPKLFSQQLEGVWIDLYMLEDKE